MEPDITPISDSTIGLNIQYTLVEPHNSDSLALASRKRKRIDSTTQSEETLENLELDEEDIGDTNDVDGVLADVVEERFSVPGFLRGVLFEELGNDSGRDHKLIIIAVHAVFLESGFVGFDPTSNMVIDGFRFRETWPSLLKMSLFYTLPELVTGAQGNTIEIIVLKFQTLGKFINVYGSLGAGGSGKTTRLNEDQLVPFLNVVWANCVVNEHVNVQDGSFLGTTPEKEVFKFWRNMKDNLALPLLIDICEKASIDLPPCFMRLPSDLKLKILETVPAVDAAKISCMCSELKYLASSDDVWKVKFAEEFGEGTNEPQGNWKKAFARKWENRKIGSELKQLFLLQQTTQRQQRFLRQQQILQQATQRQQRFLRQQQILQQAAQLRQPQLQQPQLQLQQQAQLQQRFLLHRLLQQNQLQQQQQQQLQQQQQQLQQQLQQQQAQQIQLQQQIQPLPAQEQQLRLLQQQQLLQQRLLIQQQRERLLQQRQRLLQQLQQQQQQ